MFFDLLQLSSGFLVEFLLIAAVVDDEDQGDAEEDSAPVIDVDEDQLLEDVTEDEGLQISLRVRAHTLETATVSASPSCMTEAESLNTEDIRRVARRECALVALVYIPGKAGSVRPRTD